MQLMNVLVIDGQGGGLGKQLVAALSTQCPEARLTAVGTNSLAANAMRKAGAPRAATGENAVVVNCRSADIIKEISQGTAKAMEAISGFISLLANYYDKEKR